MKKFSEHFVGFWVGIFGGLLLLYILIKLISIIFYGGTSFSHSGWDNEGEFFGFLIGAPIFILFGISIVRTILGKKIGKFLIITSTLVLLYIGYLVIYAMDYIHHAQDMRL